MALTYSFCSDASSLGLNVATTYPMMRNVSKGHLLTIATESTTCQKTRTKLASSKLKAKGGVRQQGSQPGGTQQPHENNVNIPKNEERRSNQTPGAGSGGEGG